MKLELLVSEHDLHSIANLFSKELKKEELYGTVYTSPKLHFFLKKVFHEKLDEFLVAKISGELIGALQFRELTESIHINNIVVSSSFQGARIGKRLIDWLRRFAKESKKKLTLDVNENNLRAYCWYKREGFIEISRKKSFVFEGEGRLNMEQALVLDDFENFERFGFSEARLPMDCVSRFFCIKERCLKLKSGFRISSGDFDWLMENSNVIFVITSEDFHNASAVSPSFTQSVVRMELPCA